MTAAAQIPLEIRIQASDFDVGAELQALRARDDKSVGAVATFVGLVRDRLPEQDPSSGSTTRDDISVLHLEHYPGMTEKSIEKIALEAVGRWPLLDVVIVHRVGSLTPGEQIVFVQVASSHRDAAFAGAEFIMDYLKTDAVIWKREDTSAGSSWVKATSDDQKRSTAWRSDAGSEPDSGSGSG